MAFFSPEISPWASTLACFYAFRAFLCCCGRSSTAHRVGLLHVMQGSCPLPTHVQEQAAHHRWLIASPLPWDLGLGPRSPVKQSVPFPQHELQSASPGRREKSDLLVPSSPFLNLSGWQNSTRQSENSWGKHKPRNILNTGTEMRAM